MKHSSLTTNESQVVNSCDGETSCKDGGSETVTSTSLGKEAVKERPSSTSSHLSGPMKKQVKEQDQKMETSHDILDKNPRVKEPLRPFANREDNTTTGVKEKSARSAEKSCSPSRKAVQHQLTNKHTTQAEKDHVIHDQNLKESDKKSNMKTSSYGAGAPVFPSFFKSMGHHMTSSRVDNIVSLFNQVNEHCGFDPRQFLPSTMEDHVDSDDREPALYIDADSDTGKELPMVDIQKLKDEKHKLDCRASQKLNVVESESHNPNQGLNHFNTASLLGSLHLKPVMSPCGDFSAKPIISDSTINTTQRRKTKSKRKRRKLTQGKIPCKKLQTAIEDNDNLTSHGGGVVGVMKDEQSRVQTHEKTAQNNSIGTHTVWMDDFLGFGGKVKYKRIRCEDDENPSHITIRPMNDNDNNIIGPSRRFGPKAQKKKTNHSDNTVFPPWTFPVPENPPHKDTEIVPVTEANKHDDPLNARLLSLRERHRSHSLPPKKRGIRKPCKSQAEDKNNMMDSENVTVSSHAL